MSTPNIPSLERVDLYQENEIARIVESQNKGGSRSFPTTIFDTGTNVYVYAVTTSSAEDFSTLQGATVLGKADLSGGFDIYRPTIQGSLKLTFTSKK